jgi:nicotinamide riboside transporter PnuC
MTKNLLYVLGAVFVILGILGFVNHPILGIFEVNTVHNLIHLLSGILAFVFASKGESEARTFSLILGVVYLLITVLGFIQGNGNLLSLVTINTADNFLHLVLAVVLLGLGLTKPAGSMAPTGQM